MGQINKPVLNSPVGPLPVYGLLTVCWVCCVQSRISDNSNDQDTSYFYVFKPSLASVKCKTEGYLETADCKSNH